MKSEVLLASAQAGDRQALESMFEDSKWILHGVPTYSEALDHLTRRGAPIVLCDRDLNGPAWQLAVRTLSKVRPEVCVILISNVWDEYLWKELTENGGFDIVTRPFDRIRVMAALEFAHTHVKAGWPARVS